MISEIDCFFDAGFESDATLVVSGSSKSIKVIFDNEHYGEKVYDQEINSSMPVATCKTSDLTGLKQGDTLTVNAVTYKILDIQPDGTGLTKLILKT
jgi:hypothetical protein